MPIDVVGSDCRAGRVCVPTPAAPGLAAALVGVALFGVGLLVSQLPGGRFVAPGVAAVGALLGLGALAAGGRAVVAGGTAVALNNAAALVVFFAPGWLGLPPWRAAPAHAPAGVVAVDHATRATTPVDWVDGPTASWASADVEVAVRGAFVGPLELAGPAGGKRIAEPCLQLTLRVTNAGIDRRIAPGGWAADGRADGVALTDPSGAVVPSKTFPAGLRPAEREPAPAGGLFPGHAATVLLVFEAPPARRGSFRLQLDGAAVGVASPVRFQLPGAFLGVPE